MSSQERGYNGVGELLLITVLFIGFKIGGTLTWSWWWVLSPLWLAVIVMFIVGLVMALKDTTGK